MTVNLFVLADRIDAVSCGSNDLNADIYEALGYEVVRAPRAPRGIYWRFRGKGKIDRYWHDRWEVQADFTRSIDAARNLVPSGLRLTLSEWDDEEHLRSLGPWQAILSKPGCDASFDAMKGYRCDHAATPALALCAAALRARATPTPRFMGETE